MSVWCLVHRSVRFSSEVSPPLAQCSTWWHSRNRLFLQPGKVQQFLSTMGDYPFQEGQSLNAAGINYRSLKALQVLQQLNSKGVLSPPTN